MPRYSYRARDPRGQLVEGQVEAGDRAAAIQLIEQKRCVPFKIEADGGGTKPTASPRTNGAAKPTSDSPSTALAIREASLAPTARPATALVPVVPAAPGGVKISHGQRLFFTEQLAYLLPAGMTLDEALGILVKRLKQPALQRLTAGLHRSLVDGRSFSQALRDYPRIFSSLYVNLVMAGEASGALSDILGRLVKHLGSMKQLRDRVQQALIYPAFLVVAGIGLITLFITVMVPQLNAFFQNTGGTTLPLATRVLIGVNEVFVRYWWLGVAAGFAAFALFRMLTSSPAGRLAWDRMRLGVPALGSVVRYSFYAQFARTMGTLLQNGVTLLRTMELLEDMSGNTYLRACMSRARAALVDGASLSGALGREQVFPELYLDMMAVGEQSGRFAETMQMVADVYERELDGRIKIATAIIPPIIVVIIAVLVGAVVFSIISAVFSVTNSIQVRSSF